MNCEVLTELSQRFLPGMMSRRRGTIVNVASNAAFQPLPQMAVYGATKAYVLSFTEALWHETRGTGVRVLALCPGPTETPFFEIAGEDFARSKRTTLQLIDTAKRALGDGRPSVVDGTWNALLARVGCASCRADRTVGRGEDGRLPPSTSPDPDRPHRYPCRSSTRAAPRTASDTESSVADARFHRCQ